MAFISNIVKTSLIALIRFYRFAISVMLGHCCRFEPTCSQYAIQAINQCGAWRGSYLTIRRIMRCHPWHQGGIDPVPK